MKWRARAVAATLCHGPLQLLVRRHVRAVHDPYLLDILRQPNTTSGGNAAAASAVTKPLTPTTACPLNPTAGTPKNAAIPQIKKKPLSKTAARMTAPQYEHGRIGLPQCPHFVTNMTLNGSLINEGGSLLAKNGFPHEGQRYR